MLCKTERCHNMIPFDGKITSIFRRISPYSGFCIDFHWVLIFISDCTWRVKLILWIDTVTGSVWELLLYEWDVFWSYPVSVTVKISLVIRVILWFIDQWQVTGWSIDQSEWECDWFLEFDQKCLIGETLGVLRGNGMPAGVRVYSLLVFCWVLYYACGENYIS